MLIQMQRQISSPDGRQKHERNMETDTDKFPFGAFNCSVISSVHIMKGK
jgi:hypothetical protein